MSLHIFRARDQPATRYRVELDATNGITITSRRRSCVRTMCCDRLRIAGNCIVHVYYDGHYFYCRKGRGCRS